MMELQVPDVVLYGVFTLVLGWLLHFIYRRANPACNGRLPPGSMGLPIVGETLQLLKSSSSLDIPDFYKLRLKRYGHLFKTSFVGKPVVVSMDMEFNRFMFRHNDKLFQLWYPDTINSIFGKKSISACYGSIHKYFRSFAAPLYAPKNLKEAFVSEMESIITESLRTWAANPNIEVKEAMTDMLFRITIKKVIGIESESPSTKELRKKFELFFQGLLSFPIYIPGTKFYQSMQARKYVQKLMKDLLKRRISTPQKRYGDFLDIVVEELQSEEALVDEDFMVDLVCGLIFAGIALTPTTLTIGMKFLTNSPNVVEALTEHDAILKKQQELNSRITWEEFKYMKFTNRVINEMARVSSHGPGIFRKTLKDVHVNGYTIPEGWLVLVSPMAVHLNPLIFEDPLTFNPWRWQGTHGTSLMKNFIPFGDGARHCLGADFTKLQIAMFLHALVTKYRWKEIKGGQMFRVSDLVFPQPYHIKLFPRPSSFESK
ncbi:hypothetical protein PVAP13_2NG110700 [Panicum virgatum]|uniref:Cytochrome P450 n=1 Tax=Panicum virgatum TaxID=38727 RepID=A0A8T0VCF4_PANVG|nr:hypothetical protein PVAP13_2NG110700 [Panicum virgatum]